MSTPGQLQFIGQILKHSKLLSTIPQVVDYGIKIKFLPKWANQVKEFATLAAAIMSQCNDTIGRAYCDLSDESKAKLGEQSRSILESLDTNAGQCLDPESAATIQCELSSCQQNLVYGILLQEMLCAGMIIATQTRALQRVSDEVDKAENVLQESRAELAKLRDQLERLQKLEGEVKQKFDVLKIQTNINPIDLMVLSNKLSMMSNLTQGARKSISTVKFKVDGKIVRLSDIANQVANEAILDTVQLIGHLVEFAMVGGAYTKTIRAAKIFTTASFAMLGVAKVNQYYLTEEKVRELQVLLEQIVALEREVEEINGTILEAQEWITNKLVDVQG